GAESSFADSAVLHNNFGPVNPIITSPAQPTFEPMSFVKSNNEIQDTEEIMEESLSLEEKEVELIRKALDKHNGRRRQAASELGISERTLYRKIKEYKLD
ncbi:MAG TPA: helix-turn-helix domain-containing protein, partial [Tenuifilaceae bacterium]|nr:helix-turn-helix domain-containing protein [Tenuifilaceae bacterium]